MWEAHKATMRGKLIELGAWRKREHGQQIKDTIQQIADLEKAHKLSLHRSYLESLMQKRE